MNADELCADEIACLLGNVSEPKTDVAAEAASTVPGPPRHPPAAELLEAVGRGESLAELPFSANLKFTFQSVGEEVADRLARRLKQVVGCDVQVRCGDILADTFAAWILGIEQPTCFVVASLQPLEGKLLLDMPIAFLFPALEQLLGGEAEASGQLRRPLTELEQRLSLRFTGAILDSYAAAWQTSVCLQPAVERMESNPRVVRCLPALEPILITSLAITFQGVTATVRVAAPVRTAVAACLGSSAEPDRLAHPRDRVTQPMSVCLELTLDEADADALCGGAAIRIAREALSSVLLTDQQTTLGRGELIEFHGRRAIRIRELSPAT